MATLEASKGAEDLAQQHTNDFNSNQLLQARQQAAQQASDLYKSGDIRGAYGALMAHDPEFAQKIAPDLTKVDPDLAGQLMKSTQTAQLAAQSPYNSTPGQIAKITADGHIESALARLNATAKNADDKLVHYTDAQGNLIFARTGDIKNQIGGGASNSTAAAATTPASDNAAPQDTKSKGLPTYSPPNQGVQEIDSSGKPVTIGPAANKQLIKATKDFNTDSKSLVEAINATADSQSLLDKNIPGAQIAEKIKTIKGLYGSGRIPQQLVQQYGNGTDAGFQTFLQDSISKAEGNALGDQARQNMYELNQQLNANANKEFDALLRNRSQQAADNLKIDPLIAKKRFASVGPTDYQQTTAQVNQLPPEVQAAFQFAHENLVSTDPTKQAKAKAIQQVLSQKYGIK